MSAKRDDLGTLVRRGLAWSTASNLLLRFGTVAVGIVLARLLTPEQFGVYAVALTVQTVLITFTDLGLAAGLIISDNPDDERPTVAVLGLAAGVLGFAGMLTVAGPLSRALGSPASEPAIQVLSLTLVLAGAGVVPYALLQRRFAQRAIFGISVVDFSVSTLVTLSLVVAGWGVMALAVGRVLAQSVTLVLQYGAARVLPRLSIDRTLVRPLLAFGLPVAGTTLLSWAVLSVDNVVVARIAGPVQLGYYVLAFNIATWPMSALGQVVRSVSLPAFARSRGLGHDGGVIRAMSLAWALALPAGAVLAVMAAPLVAALYGDTWRPSARVLMALGLFGGMRVLFDLIAAFLLAHGRSGRVLWIQICWCVVLVPALVLGAQTHGAAGAGWAHLAVGGLLVVPAYAVALSAEGLRVREMLAGLWRPTVACIPAALVGWLVALWVDDPWRALALGTAGGGLLYVGLTGSWLRRLVHNRADAGAAGAPVVSELGA